MDALSMFPGVALSSAHAFEALMARHAREVAMWDVLSEAHTEHAIENYLTDSMWVSRCEAGRPTYTERVTR